MARYDERICRCALNRLFGFRPDIAHAMVDVFGSAAEVFAADRKSLPPGTARYFSREGGITPAEGMPGPSARAVCPELFRSGRDILS